MKKLISSTVPEPILNGTPELPLNVIVQNVSATSIYLSFDSFTDITANGLEITPGSSYTNDYLTATLWCLAETNNNEIRIEIVPVKAWYRK